MRTIALVGAGGAIGAVARYALSGAVQRGLFPIGTLSVNALGSFLLGFLLFAGEYKAFLSPDLRLFLAIGVLGAFTTMSTFSYETMRLLDQNELSLFALNVTGTVFLCLGGVYLGKLLAGVLA